MNGWPWLTGITALPLLGGIVVLLLGRRRSEAVRPAAIGFSLVGLVWAVGLWTGFDSSLGTMQYEETHRWIPALGVSYHLGIDGLGLLLVLLTAVMLPVAILASGGIDSRVRLYYALMLFLQAGLFGTFTALNFFHWFLFWELSLIPAFFLVKFWGGPQCHAAATQFFVYTMAGSVALLLGFLALFWVTGTFDFVELADQLQSESLLSLLANRWEGDDAAAQVWGAIIFFGFLIGLGVKIPLIPLHTWLPTTYAEAPIGTTILLTGVMSKMGVYGLIRFLLPLFPEIMQSVLTLLLVLAVATILFSAFAALAQTDLKRVLAYSSINHLGYCLLGVFAAARFTEAETYWVTEKAAALNGVMLQMFNHGLTAGALFCFIGFLETRSAGCRGLHDFGGLGRVAPWFSHLMGISLLASLGMPGLNHFVGEFLIFKGAFSLASWATALAVIGLLLTAILLITLWQKVFHGPLNPRWEGWSDLTNRERMVILPITGVILVLGIYPQWVVEFINPTVLRLVTP